MPAILAANVHLYIYIQIRRIGWQGCPFIVNMNTLYVLKVFKSKPHSDCKTKKPPIHELIVYPFVQNKCATEHCCAQPTRC